MTCSRSSPASVGRGKSRRSSLDTAKEGAARIAPLRQFTQPLNERGWIPWSALAFGLAVFGAMTAIIVTYLGRTQANASWPIAVLRAARLGACNG